MDFYSYMNDMNSIQEKEESSKDKSDLSEENKKEGRNNKKIDEISYRNSEAPNPPAPKWFDEIRKTMKNKIISDVKDQFEAELKAKKEEDLKRKKEEQQEAQKTLKESVEQNGGNINGLGNGEFLDPNVNNPENVQKEGSMAACDRENITNKI